MQLKSLIEGLSSTERSMVISIIKGCGDVVIPIQYSRESIQATFGYSFSDELWELLVEEIHFSDEEDYLPIMKERLHSFVKKYPEFRGQRIDNILN